MSDEVYKLRNRLHTKERRRRIKAKETVILVADDETLEMYSESFSPSADDVAERRETARLLMELIDTCLTEQERDAVIHIFYEGYTQKEAADIMGISQPTVNIYLKRALKKLRDNMYNFDK